MNKKAFTNNTFTVGTVADAVTALLMIFVILETRDFAPNEVVIVQTSLTVVITWLGRQAKYFLTERNQEPAP